MAASLVLITTLIFTFSLSTCGGSTDRGVAVASGAVVAFLVVLAILAWIKARSEGFAVMESTKILRTKKTDAMVPAIAQFFSSGAPAVYKSDISTYGVFWQPSAGDYQSTFVRGAGGSKWSIDDITCIDRVSKLPMRIIASPIDSIMSEAPSPNNCRVFIDGNVYVAHRNAILARCKVAQSGPWNMLLHLERDNLATRNIMLLRPFFVRVGGMGGQLFRVVYGHGDGMDYDSAASSEFATLKLQTAPQWDNLEGSGAYGPPKSLGVHAVICYYMSYQMPRAGLAGTSNDIKACSLVVPGTGGVSRMVGRVYDARRRVYVRKLLMEMRVSTSPQAVTNIRLMGARSTYSVPAGNFTVATYTRDCLIIASISENRTIVKRFHNLPVPCKYRLVHRSHALQHAHGGVAFPKTSIPNFAVVSGRLQSGGMSSTVDRKVIESATNASPLAKSLFATPDAPDPASDTLLAFPRQALPPGARITSRNEKFFLAYEHAGSLVLRSAINCDDNILWSSKTDHATTSSAGMCRLDPASGVITLQDKRGQVYWRSSPRALPGKDTFGHAPFRLTLTDRGFVETRGANDKMYLRLA